MEKLERDPRLEDATQVIRQLRDACLAIANAGPDMPTNAIRSVAALAARRADDVLTALAR